MSRILREKEILMAFSEKDLLFPRLLILRLESTHSHSLAGRRKRRVLRKGLERILLGQP